MMIIRFKFQNKINYYFLITNLIIRIAQKYLSNNEPNRFFFRLQRLVIITRTIVFSELLTFFRMLSDLISLVKVVFYSYLLFDSDL